MTISIAQFTEQLQLLHDQGYKVIRLRQLTDYLQGKLTTLPEKAVVITADDGNVTVFTNMFPLITRYHVPVTLFIYPSAISNASYALTWEDLQKMKESGLVDVQSHTFWHPNFEIEKYRLSSDQYQAFVDDQLNRSRTIIQDQLGGTVDMLAWPFGIHDIKLEEAARRDGYVAAFSIERKHVDKDSDILAIPRYIVTPQTIASFKKLLDGHADPVPSIY